MLCLKSSSFFFFFLALLHSSFCGALLRLDFTRVWNDFGFTEICVVILIVIVNVDFNPDWGDGVMGKYRYSNKLE